MNSKLKKLGVGIAIGAFLAISAVPAAFADTNVGVAGNGAFSDTSAHVSNSNSTEVSQSNNTSIHNDVSTTANTGGNHASFNTGGSVTIYTGGATSDVNIANAAGSNVASVGKGCGCDNSSSTVWVSGNGAFSSSNVSVSNSTREDYRQSNREYFSNYVTNQLKTGHNSADFNTGTDVVVISGGANASTWLNNQGGLNVLH